MVTRQGLKNAKVNTNCDIEIAFYGTSLSAKTGQITVVKKFENTLRDLDRLFYCQVDGNVILIRGHFYIT